MKPGLALDRMTTEQVRSKVWELIYDLEPYNLALLELRVRQERWRWLKAALLELELRGTQLALCVLVEEEVSRHRSVDAG